LNRRLVMHIHDYVLLALAGLMIGAAFALVPNSTARGVSIQSYQIDISGGNRNTTYLPEEEFPAH
jgi:hypothetical protein